MTEIITEYGAALCCFRRNTMLVLSEFNCLLGRGYGTICLTLGVGRRWAGAPGFWLIILIIWIFSIGFLSGFYVRQENLSDIKTGEGAEIRKIVIFEVMGRLR
ncbi:hypothetical protein [Acetobacter ghanensis]|uniref:Uncharacterized protein n=1 Tax=Acetobacter ghanensis TaxID=431306 RepID=A0A0U5F6K3_9PROT|nr:hypothetical protein [Acetobacter ghanensis]NHO40390.1 hypothetical protein [Acetobacter ghanensis]CEF57365.1 hypothetical protein predicted by Glimmer/Critica [Acetobacter ghanensis]